MVLFAFKELKVFLGKGGYMYCKMKKNLYLFHRLKFETINGFLERGREINHIDGNKANNDLINLEEVWHVENIRHAIFIGLFRNGLNLKKLGEANIDLIFKEPFVEDYFGRADIPDLLSDYFRGGLGCR